MFELLFDLVSMIVKWVNFVPDLLVRGLLKLLGINPGSENGSMIYILLLMIFWGCIGVIILTALDIT